MHSPMGGSSASWPSSMTLHENAWLVADTSLSGLRVTRELDIVMVQRGRPHTIVSDNGTELTQW